MFDVAIDPEKARELTELHLRPEKEDTCSMCGTVQ